MLVWSIPLRPMTSSDFSSSDSGHNGQIWNYSIWGVVQGYETMFFLFFFVNLSVFLKKQLIFLESYWKFLAFIEKFSIFIACIWQLSSCLTSYKLQYFFKKYKIFRYFSINATTFQELQFYFLRTGIKNIVQFSHLLKISQKFWTFIEYLFNNSKAKPWYKIPIFNWYFF